MIRVFANTQPGVLSMTHIVPDSEFPLYWSYLNREFYLARRGDGWVLYKPSVIHANSPTSPLT